MTIYSRIPGYAHLSVLVPQDRIIYAREPDAMDETVRRRIRNLVLLALEVATRQRPLSHLHPDRYSRSIILHLSAWVHTRKLLGERYELISLHTRANGEYHGSAILGNETRAFTGTFKDGSLASFRLL